MLQIAYDHETIAGAGERCTCARDVALYNCRDCFQYGVSCKACLMESHLHHPLHRICVWSAVVPPSPEHISAEDDDRREDGGKLANVLPWEPGTAPHCLPNSPGDADGRAPKEFFNRTSLASLGMVIRLGHRGQRCPDRYYQAEPNKDIQTVRVLHENGVHLVRIQYCRCGSLSTFSSSTGDNSPHQQLWRAGLYPATYKQPRTVASLSVLEMFRILTCEGKINSSAFFTFLRRVGAVVFEEESPVSCQTSPKSYLRAYRLQELTRSWFSLFQDWLYIYTLKQYGELPRAPNGNHEQGALARFCPACPQPHLGNMDPGWKLRPEFLQ